MLLLLALDTSAFAGGVTKESNVSPSMTKNSGVIPIGEVYASSELIENGLVHVTENVVDGKTSTCWADGVDGYGIGETIMLILDGSYDISKISITGGWAFSTDLFEHNAKPAVIFAYFSSSPDERYRISLDETSSTQSFVIDERNVKWVTFDIREVYQGKKGVFDTSISEITLYGNNVIAVLND